jgi:hypothetical protein
MNKRKAKAIAYHCFASITEEIVANMDWSEYDERDKELIIKCIDDLGSMFERTSRKLDTPPHPLAGDMIVGSKL